MADAVESSALTGDTPDRRVRERSAWRLLLEHVRSYRWMILGGDSWGSWGTGVGHSPPARVGVTGQHRGSLNAHNRADLPAGIHPLQTIVNHPYITR
jgi:hypothetical protein